MSTIEAPKTQGPTPEELRQQRIQFLKDRIQNDFTYHRPGAEAIADMKMIRGITRDLANFIAEIVPPGREQATALTKLEECMMHANAGISRQFPTETA